MIKKILFIAAALFLFAGVYGLKSQTLEGNYFLGDQKITISVDDDTYYVKREGTDQRWRLQYEENTPENDQIWVEWQKGNQTGTYVLKSDYSSGIYTDYRTQKESYVKKIE